MGTHGGKAPSPSSQARRWLTSVVHSEQGKAVVRAACELLFEFVLIFIFLKAYNIVRNQFGSLKVSAAYALRHAEQIIWAERVTGMFWEQEIQDLFLPFTTWIRLWNIFYGSAHMAVTVFVLLFLFGLKPRAYQRYRTVFVIMNILAIAGYAMYPLMPPRLLATCDGQYGGCVKRYRFVDTMEEYGGLWSWHDTHIAKASNHYAAMPSMHAGYSVWCALAMYEHSPILVRVRFIFWVYPLLTLYCIVVTGNHYFLDAVAGILCLLVALRTAHLMPKAGRGAELSEEGSAYGGTAKEGEELEPLLTGTGSGGAGGGADASLKKGTEGVVFVTVVVDPQQGGKVGRADDAAVIRAQQRHHSANAVNGCEARGNVCTLRVGGQPPCTAV